MVTPPLMSEIAKSLYEKVIKKSRPKKTIDYITTKQDYGDRPTFNLWNGKNISENELNEIIKVTQDTNITRPSGIPIAFIVTNVFDNDDMRKILYAIKDTTVMRTNCSGRIDHEDMEKKGMIHGVDYKLRTPNSYYRKKKNGEWNRIAIGNEIDSVLIGAKRSRFTGTLKITNAELWEQLKPLTLGVENAFKKIAPEIYKKQKLYCEKAIEEKYRHGIITTLSANRYSEEGTTQMSLHSDGFDSGYTTMSCFRDGNYKGGYLCFPRWGIGIDLPDNSVCIADSQSLHGVTKITGRGKRFTTVCYTDKSVATIPPFGKEEMRIGKLKQKEEKGDWLKTEEKIVS